MVESELKDLLKVLRNPQKIKLQSTKAQKCSVDDSKRLCDLQLNFNVVS